MPRSSEIDNALIAKLLGDATLTTLLPDGVYWDEARANATRFLVVTLVDDDSESTFSGGRTIERPLYSVTARSLSSAGVDMAQAAERIDTLLQDGTLTAEGYGLMDITRESRIRRTEVDAVDRSIRWYRRGGLYRVEMAVGTPGGGPPWIQSPGGWTQ